MSRPIVWNCTDCVEQLKFLALMLYPAVYTECHAWMQGIVEAIPELLGTIQAQLLDLLSLVLAGRPYRDSMHPSHLAAYHAAVTHGELTQMCGYIAPGACG